MSVDPYALAGIDLTDFLDRPAWHADALCKEHRDVNFLPGRGESVTEANEQIEFGIWAGTSERERKRPRNAA